MNADDIDENTIHSCVAFTHNGAWDKTLSYTDHRWGHSSWETCAGVYLMSTLGDEDYIEYHTTTTILNMIVDVIHENINFLLFDQRFREVVIMYFVSNIFKMGLSNI